MSGLGEIAGTAAGGPIGGQIGGILGGQLDQAGGSQGSATSQNMNIQTGLSDEAASAQRLAAVNAAAAAGQAFQQGTNKALSDIMQTYGQTMSLASPAISAGNAAAAQYNYMLGLPANAPGAAPIAPVNPTLESETAKITAQQIQAYAGQNLSLGEVNAQGNQYGPRTNTLIDPLTGYVNTNANKSGSMESGASFLQSQAQRGEGIQNTGIYKDIGTYLGQQNLTQAQEDYKNKQALYSQQMDQYNQQKALYDQYAAKGVATPDQINSIVQGQPGFGFEQKQGINAIQNAASASGMLNSGNLLKGLEEFGQDLSSKYYQQYMNNLNTQNQTGQAATGQAMNATNLLGQNQSTLQMQNAGNQGNVQLAMGGATASAYDKMLSGQAQKYTPYTTSSTSQQSSGLLGSTLGRI